METTFIKVVLWTVSLTALFSIIYSRQGFYTSIVRGGDECDEGHGDYEPPPMVITTSHQEDHEDDEEEVNALHTAKVGMRWKTCSAWI